ncbi:MAG: peptidoglycan-binding protein [Clostridia bacterium]|nr:peptidoglycan-binding protein [Clostridia bacterium]
MKKRFSVLCSVIAVFALIITVMGVKAPVGDVKNDVSYGALEQYYDDADDMNTTLANEPTEGSGSTTSSALDGLGDLLGGFGGSGDLGSGLVDGIGGVGGIFGDAGDLFGSLLGGGSGSSSNGVLNTTVGGNDVIYIDPVPAATQAVTQGETIVPPAGDSQGNADSTTPVAETVDPTAKTNPYSKPTGEIKPGDVGDGVKWIQWNLIYTGYAPELKEATGIYDEATVEIVKKLQAEKGLAPDGIVNDDDVAAVELLYYEYIIKAQTTSTPSTTADGITTVGGNVASGQDDGGSDILVIIIAVVLIAFIWLVAIVVIVIILIKKKKQKKAEAEKKDADVKPEGEEKPQTNGDMSLSDLFEEANNKKK